MWHGYELDAQNRPIFHYSLNDVDVREQPLPHLRQGSTGLIRQFRLAAGGEAKGWYLLAAAGKKIEPKGPGEWLVDDKLLVRLAGPAGAKLAPVVRDSGGMRQLIVPVTFTSGKASIDVETDW